MKKVIFICHGNICRSPMAEAVFSHMTRQRGCDRALQCSSAGIISYHSGDDADPRTREVLERHNIPINHTARGVVAQDFTENDHIIAMDRSNLTNLFAIAPDERVKSKISMFRRWDPDGDGDVEDPYYDKLTGFETLYDMVCRVCRLFIDFLLDEDLANNRR